MGDFNIDLLDPQHYLFDELSDFQASFNLNQLVTHPTWYGHGKPSILDHIYTNDFTSVDKLQYLAPIGRCKHALLQFSVDLKPKSVQNLAILEIFYC